jgi:hypothetical protein
MAEIRNYTMNFNSDITCLRQVSLRCNKPQTRRLVVDRGNDVLRAKVHG